MEAKHLKLAESEWLHKSMLVNTKTGEMKVAPEGLAAFITVKHRAGRHMSTLIEALESVAKDATLTINDHRILRFIESKMEYANSGEGHPDSYVRIIQADIARELNLHKPNVSNSIKKLLERKIILRMAPKGQASSYFAINPNYGWRGGHKEWKKRRGESPKLQLLKGGQEEKPVSAILRENGEPALFES